MQQFNHFALNIKGDIATLTFQWSDPAELDPTLLREFSDAMDYIEDQTACCVIVFQGLGVPSAGQYQHALNLDQYSKWEKCLQRIERFSGASLACIHGTCSWFHLQFMLACDLRLATAESTFRSSEIKHGVLPGMGLFRLAKYVNPGRARRFLFLNEVWRADQAYDVGLIDRVCAAEETDKTIQHIYTSLSPVCPDVLRNARRLLDESFATSFQDATGHYLAAQSTCLFAVRKKMS